MSDTEAAPATADPAASAPTKDLDFEEVVENPEDWAQVRGMLDYAVEWDPDVTGIQTTEDEVATTLRHLVTVFFSAAVPGAKGLEAICTHDALSLAAMLQLSIIDAMPEKVTYRYLTPPKSAGAVLRMRVLIHTRAAHVLGATAMFWDLVPNPAARHHPELPLFLISRMLAD